MIKSREKKEEYRDLSIYFIHRFMDFYCGRKIITPHDLRQFENDYNDNLNRCLSKINWRRYDTTTFSNGMTPPVPRFEIELKGISIGEGNPDWGAIPGKKYFVLELGEIL